jgi:Mannosyl-glycoprotein endo-beta-N-acetylglucosaminidase
MSLPFVREFKLAGSSGDGRHPYVDKNGVFIGQGTPLLERDVRGQWKPRAEAAIEGLLSRGYGAVFKLGWRYRQLHRVAEALNEGDLALASISLLHVQLAPLPSDERDATARAGGPLAKENVDWQDEPRVPAGSPDGGEWTSGSGGSGSSSLLQPAAAQGDGTQARKERFVDAHLADAQKITDELGVPVENILGISALESKWGASRFAIEGNNYFGLHFPAPYATGYLIVQGSGVRVATFASYADSARSFAAVAGRFARNLTNSGEFAAALHEHSGFGVGNPNYVSDAARTIGGLRSLIARRQI